MKSRAGRLLRSRLVGKFFSVRMPRAPEHLYSWGGSSFARGWSGSSSTGAGPAQPVSVQLDPSRLASTTSLLVRPIVAASRNSMAITSEGQVITWGLNDSRGGGDAWFVRGGHMASIPDSGQLGRHRDGHWALKKPEAPSAISIGPLAAEGAGALASGRYHALAIGLRSQAVYSWGLNDHGQLGRSGWAESKLSYSGGGKRAARAHEKPPRSCMRGSRCRDGTPLPVEGIRTAVAVAAGRYFSVALGTDGRAYAWGRCACGGTHQSSAAAHQSKRVDGGGDSDNGFGGYQPYPLTGGGIERERLVAVSAGYAHMLLLASSGLVYTCESGDDGYGGRLQTAPPHNAFGQLGRGGPPLVPLPIPNLRLAAASLADMNSASPNWSSAMSAAARLIAAGRCASFAADANGAVHSWGCAQANGHGSNTSRASGSAWAPTDVRAPARLEMLRGVRVRMLAAGEYHAVALTSSCALVAWGAAASGAGGAGGAGGTVPVRGLPAGGVPGAVAPCEVVDIAAGYQHSLAVLREGAR